MLVLFLRKGYSQFNIAVQLILLRLRYRALFQALFQAGRYSILVVGLSETIKVLDIVHACVPLPSNQFWHERHCLSRWLFELLGLKLEHSYGLLVLKDTVFEALTWLKGVLESTDAPHCVYL